MGAVAGVGLFLAGGTLPCLQGFCDPPKLKRRVDQLCEHFDGLDVARVAMPGSAQALALTTVLPAALATEPNSSTWQKGRPVTGRPFA